MARPLPTRRHDATRLRFVTLTLLDAQSGEAVTLNMFAKTTFGDLGHDDDDSISPRQGQLIFSITHLKQFRELGCGLGSILLAR